MLELGNTNFIPTIKHPGAERAIGSSPLSMEASKPAKRRLVSANDDSAHKKRKVRALSLEDADMEKGFTMHSHRLRRSGGHAMSTWALPPRLLALNQASLEYG